MIITRKETKQSDGSMELYELANEYVTGSVLGLGMGTTISGFEVIELGGNFVQITPAPTDPILFIYDIESADIVSADDIISDLSPWDSKRIIKLMTIVKELQDSMDKVETYLVERLTKEEFNSWAAVMEKRFNEIQSQL